MVLLLNNGKNRQALGKKKKKHMKTFVHTSVAIFFHY